MVKKAKYSSELTEEDHRVINHIILVCATSFSMLLMKYQSPEQLANYWRKKIFNTKLGLAGFCLLLDARSKSSSKRLVSPTQLNNEIARKMHASDFNENEINSTVPLKSEKLPDSYLHPRDMRKVLMVCEEIGFYIHIEGKKDIKKEAKSRPGRSKSEIKKIKGRPSRYKIANDIDKFSKVLSKPQARELLNESLLKSNLFYSYLKFISKAFWYALRKDKTASGEGFQSSQHQHKQV